MNRNKITHTMNAHQCNQILLALSDKGLKAKHLSTDNFFKLIAAKKKITDALQSTIEAERMIIEEYGATEEPSGNPGMKLLKCENPEFFKRLKEVQAKDHDIPELNFIPADEFKKFVDEIDIESASLLYEFLAAK